MQEIPLWVLNQVASLTSIAMHPEKKKKERKQERERKKTKLMKNKKYLPILRLRVDGLFLWPFEMDFTLLQCFFPCLELGMLS